LVDKYPDTFAVIEYQISNPPWSLPWGEDRADYYGVYAIPWFQYDGLFDAWPIGSYESKFLNRQAETTDVTMEMAGKSLGGSEYQVAVRVGIEAGGAGKTLYIYTVQALDHRTTIKPYTRNSFKLAADTMEITLEPGTSTSLVHTFDLDAESMGKPDDIRFFAWAQDPSNTGGVVEIHQGAKLLPPFDGYADCNANGIPDAWDIADGTSEDLDGDGVPDECGCIADITGDDVVDVLDLLDVLGAWGLTGVPEDVNGDGIVDVIDLIKVLGQWGPC